jgi:hypothetical protein
VKDVLDSTMKQVLIRKKSGKILSKMDFPQDEMHIRSVSQQALMIILLLLSKQKQKLSIKLAENTNMVLKILENAKLFKMKLIQVVVLKKVK